MENKVLKNFKVIYFMAVAVLMYYFLTEYIDVGLYITFRHFFALLFALSAVAVFLIKPDVGRGVTSFCDALIYSIPLWVTTAVSLFIWSANMVDTEVISRGLSSSFVFANMFSFALCAGAFLYMFGEKGIMYNLTAILIANVLMIFTIIGKYGLGNYFSELITLIITFAEQTGDIIIEAEIHELAFCIGAYLIYLLYKPKKNPAYFILLGLSIFCFLSAFKRIAIIAVVIALAFGYFLKFVAKFNKKTAMGLITLLSISIIALLVAYIALIKLDAFELLEKAGINTSGRVGIYNAVDEFYDFDPAFTGNGIGFLTYQLNTNMSVDVAAIHNDFLQHFIDLGFFGYIIWLFSITLVRVLYFGRDGRIDSAIVSFMLTVYLIIASSTDNTMNYPLLTGVLAILMMGCGYDDNVRKNDIKIFGYITKANQKKESEHYENSHGK